MITWKGVDPNELNISARNSSSKFTHQDYEYHYVANELIRKATTKAQLWRSRGAVFIATGDV